MKISSIIKKAKEKHLFTGKTDEWISYPFGVWKETCCAVAEAEAGHDQHGNVILGSSKAVKFMQKLGCPKEQAIWFEDDIETQRARFIWLDFAELIAKDYEKGLIKL